MTRTRQQSRGMCRACGYVGTKASMTRHLEKCVGRLVGRGTGHEVYRLRVSGSDRPEYWLDVELPVGAGLDDLDSFLRGIWLECCGHLSEFTVGPQTGYDADPFRPPKRGKQPSLEKLGLQVGQKFGYTYDFGSSTDLTLQVQAREEVGGTVGGTAREQVRLLARNLPPALTCSRCGAPARWAHSWEYDEDTGRPVLYCGRHGKSTRDEQLPVVNSPRMGVCGYEGGNDESWPPAPKEGEGEEIKPVKAQAAQPRAAKPRASQHRPAEADTLDTLLATLGQLALEDDGDGEDLLTEAQALPLNADSAWLIVTQELPGLLPPEEGLPVVVLVLDTASGRILRSEVIPDPTPEDLGDVALLAMLEPGVEDVSPQRPGQLFSMDAGLTFSLHTALAGLDVRVARQDFPGLDDLLSGLKGQLYGNMRQLEEGQRPRPFLADVSEEDVQALLTAFARFLRARPWQVFAPHRPLYARWTNADGTAGQLYASVMGELGEVHGLALYPDWLSYSGHLNNSFNPELALRATGGLESLSQGQPDELHPDDWARLQAAGLPHGARSGPTLRRFGPQGTLPPRTPLRPLIAVLNVLSERAERRATPVTSLKGEQDDVQVRFPAGPRDELSAEQRRGRVQVRLQSASPKLISGETVIVGPPDLLLRQAFAEARRWLEREKKGLHFYLPFRLELPEAASAEAGPFGPLRVRVWESDAQAPNLTLAHLTRLGPLVDSLGTTLHAMAQAGQADGVSVEWRDA